MCLLVFNWESHSRYKLILVANRDEFFDRPSEPLHEWTSGMIAGKDLQSGGTWIGMHPDGKFAALTNVRDFENPRNPKRSRGFLIKEFLEGNLGPRDYLKSIKEKINDFDGFNLLVGDKEELYYLSSHSDKIQLISPGLHGISNATIDVPWPKVEKAKKQLKSLIHKNDIDQKELLKLLQDKNYAEDQKLPDTGVPRDMERKLSAQFIQLDDYYGTVNTSAILWEHNGRVVFAEKRVIPEAFTLKEFNL